MVSSIGKDPKRSLEVASSSDAWDETNNTWYGFGHGRLRVLAENLLVLKKIKIKITYGHFFYITHGKS